MAGTPGTAARSADRRRMLATRRLLTRAWALRGAATGARASRRSVARSVAQRCAFSSDAGDERVNGELNPFERLLQHSQQFRAQMGELEGQEGDGEEQEDGGASHSDSDDSDSDDSDSDDSDSDDSDSGEEEDVDEERAGEDELQDEKDDGEGEDEVEAVDLEGARARAEAARRFRRPSRARMQRNARISRSVRDHILSVPDDALDYEHELESVDVHRARERKFHQLLRRQQDANRVCRNCGERGHVARNCLLPVICSNCGGVGHGARDCLHPSALAPAKKHHHHPRQDDEGDSPVQTRYDRFKEAFDVELDEYLTNYKPRSKKKKSPVEASEEQDSAPSN